MIERGSPPLENRPETPDLRGDPEAAGDAGRVPGRRRSRLLSGVFSVAVNLLVFTALFWPHAAPPPPPFMPSLTLVRVAELPKPKPPGPPNASQFEAASLPEVQPIAPPHVAAPMVMIAPSKPDTSDLLSDSQLAGATSAGEEGSGGGGCDTARALQRALRRDPLVRTAVEDAHRIGKSIMLWDGDWVRSGDQEGKGLSAVREAIMWEVAFAPEACRNERVHGLVLLSLADGATRFAIGSGDWRWSDLLFVHGVRSVR